jgi:hypothetical protein
MGGFADRQAVTRVNPEQASKVKLCVPIRLRFEEGRSVVQATTDGMTWLRRTEVVGTACREGQLGNVGDPVGCGSGIPPRRLGRRPGWESERSIVPSSLGNARGGKGPHFWERFPMETSVRRLA